MEELINYHTEISNTAKPSISRSFNFVVPNQLNDGEVINYLLDLENLAYAETEISEVDKNTTITFL